MVFESKFLDIYVVNGQNSPYLDFDLKKLLFLEDRGECESGTIAC